MKYQSLYRKYRPSDFNEMYGQKIAKKILKNSIINNRLSHAYLFFGPRGTGKTSMAKMFARICNCLEPIDGNCCEKCQNCIESKEKSCVDIIEIDAASNNGVDEIRELKNKISLVPNKLKYKVYIIDEVHMLSTGAFNALLKTLEEPPEHIVFILATTEFYKVPNTIVSRCQTIEFKNISEEDIFDRLKEISFKEEILITDEAIREIAIYSNGGLRDAIGLLEKVNLFVGKENTIQVGDVQESFGMISDLEIRELIDYIDDTEENKILEKVKKIISSGKDLMKVSNQILIAFRKKIIENNNYSLIEKIKIINNYQEQMKKSHNQSLLFEMLFIELITKTNVRPKEEKNIASEIKKTEKSMMDEISSDSVNNKQKTTININKNIRINNSFATADKNKLLEIKQKWDSLKEFVFDSKIGALCCDLVDAVPVVCSNTNLILCTEYSSTSEKMNDVINDYEMVLQTKFNLKLNIIAVSKEEWNELKKKYIENIRSNYKYEYIDENQEKIVKNKEKNDNISNDEMVTKVKELFADFNIEEE